MLILNEVITKSMSNCKHKFDKLLITLGQKYCPKDRWRDHSQYFSMSAHVASIIHKEYVKEMSGKEHELGNRRMYEFLCVMLCAREK